MRRDLTAAGVVWLLVTLASAAATYFLMDPFPTQGAEEAKELDDAFLVMTYMASPVFGLVFAAVTYSVIRFRSPGQPTEDGPAISGEGAVPRVWLVLTTILAVVVMIYPGLIGLAELRADETSELDISVTGMMWQWVIEYPDSEVRISGKDTMVLPADTRIKFDITSLDVVHSFWVPAFRQKIDAVPGQTTTMYLTMADPSDPEDPEAAYRLQCAELCGLLHSDMVLPVQVVEREAFESWLNEKSQSAARVR